ncbi:MAG: phosphoribosylamine--glycine ligase family protein [Sphingobacterium sp.]|nr:phosphoribosylamine--glycine ligase family protein [Sphingobacterium sp.]
MNVLILGSGGREHTLAWKISQSPLIDSLFIAPGNAGTRLHGTIIIDPSDFNSIGDFAKENKIELIIAGTEDPLLKGFSIFFMEKPNLKE